VRFELTNGSHRRQFSRLLPSTTRPRFLIRRIIPNLSCAEQHIDRPATISTGARWLAQGAAKNSVHATKVALTHVRAHIGSIAEWFMPGRSPLTMHLSPAWRDLTQAARTNTVNILDETSPVFRKVHCQTTVLSGGSSAWVPAFAGMTNFSVAVKIDAG
jgi:hypothetical protein